jgi:hypothetical protein
MSRRSSLGVTVLALVAFHSLSPIGLIASERAAITTKVLYRLIDPDEHLDAREVPSTLERELEAGRIRAEERIWPYIHVTIGELIELWQPDATKCSDDFFRQVERWYRSSFGSLNSYIHEARQRRQYFCFSHLEPQIKDKCGSAVSESTREHFESFEKHQSIHDNFDNPERATSKLRKIIESSGNADQLAIAKGYLRACEDVIERCASIKPIRAKYLTTAFVTPTKIWPHVQFYDFCRQLFKFDFSHKVDGNVEDLTKVTEYFDEIQEQNRAQSLTEPNPETMSSENAESDREQEQSSAAEAAVRKEADWVSEDGATEDSLLDWW